MTLIEKEKTVEGRVWNYLFSKIKNAYGVAGLMGNLRAESGLIFNRVEILCLKRLKEHGKVYSDSSYTAAIDNGKISRSEFLNPLPGKQYGYGLAQWTSPGRKAGLYDLAKTKGVSIADEENTLDYLMKELSTSYTSVLTALKTATSVKQASDIVLKRFECPPDTGASVQSIRAKYGQEYYDKFFKPASNTDNIASAQPSIAQAIDKVIKIAANELGYLEKATNNHLDSKTANAGSNNYTKYWRDVYPAYQGQAWCACFVSWVFMKAFGKDTAKKILRHWPYVYCPTLGTLFTKHANPKAGDIVIFYRNGTFAHTGIVTKVSGDKFWTIEGNTSGASGVIANGGGVCQKSYFNSKLPGTKFCRPDYTPVTSLLSNLPSQKPDTAGSNATKTENPPNTVSAKIDPAYSFSKSLAGTYTTTTALNLRTGAGTDNTRQKIQCVIPCGGTVRCYGYYTEVNHTKWYLVTYRSYTGFVSSKYLKR